MGISPDISQKPRLLDLFCGAGGAAMGYARAGFEVVGVDIEAQPHYPFEFHQQDAMEVLSQGIELQSEFDVIHASPPCQAYSDTGTSRRRTDHPDLVAPVRALLKAAGRPYIIENIPGAPLEGAVVLCGGTFGLPIIRHRLFETSFAVLAPKMCTAVSSRKVTGHRSGGPFYPYGRKSWEAAWREFVLPVVWPWMTIQEAGQAIPPAYTEFLGRQLLDQLAVAA